MAVGTDLVWEIRILELTTKGDKLDGKLASTRPRTLEIDNVIKDNSKVQFYTGFPSKENLQICFEFAGYTVNHFKYWKEKNTTISQRKILFLKCGLQRKLSPLEEFCLVRRIWLIGSVYMYLLFMHIYHMGKFSHKFKQITLWSLRSQIQQHRFRKKVSYHTNNSRCYRDSSCPTI